ncbi:type I pullulanase [Pedobacter miscanthi]|uniref:type I pullulanase n=1 Tax=Pedobacter miscanthi TaxID=2259170 RepID=UPI002930B331|nr:type I pullulanase [Pedobacter miscanthi]
MKKLIFLFLSAGIFLISFSRFQEKTWQDEQPVYNGKDLGVTYSAKVTHFKVWSPTASAVKLRLYAAGTGGEPLKTADLIKSADGTWEVSIRNNVKNLYYTFQTNIADIWQGECPDSYAKAVGVNGKRGMIVDMAETDPSDWANDKKPVLKNFNDIVLYELHIRDLSVNENSGIKNKGKFLGLTELGTKSKEGEPTGLDHIKQLGVTHIHLLPSFDFSSVDETKNNGKYNWGYDPLNYNVPEGSYATDPYDGRVRIREFKQMVKTLHSNGLRVILDVVYNHTSGIKDANFTQFAPGYFYRHNADGSYSNATACGNETASEKAMMRKFMTESVVYWAKEYHLDGFRFDLMGVHDIETMNQISDTLHKLDPTIFIYGEAWDAGASPLPAAQRALKKNMQQLNQVAAFSDDIRDAIRGARVKVKGFVSGETNATETLKFGITGSVQHPQVNYNLSRSKAPWAREPYQTISYASCHDDNCLYDRLKLANPEADEDQLIEMDKLANAIVFTSQGIPFIQAGEEFLRTKQMVSNSYNKPDSINQLEWSRKAKYKTVYNYYKDFIALRKHHPAFRMPSAVMIQKHLEFLDAKDPALVAYQLKDNANKDKWKNILVVMNGSLSAKDFQLPQGQWTLVADGQRVNEGGINKQISGSKTLAPTAIYIFHQ